MMKRFAKDLERIEESKPAVQESLYVVLTDSIGEQLPRFLSRLLLEDVLLVRMSRNRQKIAETWREILQIDALVAIAVEITEDDVGVHLVDVERGTQLGELFAVDVAALVKVTRPEQLPQFIRRWVHDALPSPTAPAIGSTPALFSLFDICVIESLFCLVFFFFFLFFLSFFQ